MTDADRYRYDARSGNIIDTHTGQLAGWVVGDFGARLAGTGIVHQRFDRLPQRETPMDLREEAGRSVYAPDHLNYRRLYGGARPASHERYGHGAPHERTARRR